MTVGAVVLAASRSGAPKQLAEVDGRERAYDGSGTSNTCPGVQPKAGLDPDAFIDELAADFAAALGCRQRAQVPCVTPSG